MYYVFITKNTLPRISQNLKLNKKILELYNGFFTKEFQDVNLLSYIHKPTNILSYLIYKESLCLIFLQQSARTLTDSYIASLNRLIQTHEKDLKVRFLKLSRTYLRILNDMK